MGTKFDRYGPQMIADLVRDFGLKDFQAAGFPGNAGGESRGFEDIVEDGAKAKGWAGGHGWFQWTGMRPGERRLNFQRWLTRMTPHGYRADNYLGNYSFLFRELKGAEGRRVLPRLRACQTVEEATQVVCRVYERPDPEAARKSMPIRISYAKRALELYRQTPDGYSPIAPNVSGPSPMPSPPSPMPSPPSPMPSPIEVPKVPQTPVELPSEKLPDPKSGFQSRTILTVVSTLIIAWLTKLMASYNIIIPPGWEGEVQAAIFSVGLVAAGIFHKYTNTAVIGSPLGNQIMAAKEEAADLAMTRKPDYPEFEEGLPPQVLNGPSEPGDLLEVIMNAKARDLVEYGPAILEFLQRFVNGMQPSLPRLPAYDVDWEAEANKQAKPPADVAGA